MLVKRRALAAALLLMLGVTGAIIGVRTQAIRPVTEMYNLPTAATSQTPVFYVKTDQKLMALTFDISWGKDTPIRILDVLARYNQKATFFLSGPWANHYRNTVTRIVEEGHEIASHGQEHINLSQESKQTVRDNIQSAHDILVNLTNTTPEFFRPPNGDYDDLVVLTARELGYETVIWSLDSLDWKNPGVSYMVEIISKYSFPGAIILFHASDSAKETHEALPLVIENLRAAGYELLTLGELVSRGTPARDDPRGRPPDQLPGADR